MIRKRDSLYKNALNNLKEKDIYNDYLKVYYNNEKNKLDIMENQYKQNSNTDSYNSIVKLLKKYENQIKIRDRVIEQNEIAINHKDYLSIDKIKNDNLLPLIAKLNPSRTRLNNKTPNLMPKQKSQLKLPLIHNVSSAKHPNNNKNLNNYYYMNQYLSNNRSSSNNYNINVRTKTNPSNNNIKRKNNNEQSSIDDKSILSNNYSRNENSDLFDEQNRSRDNQRNNRQNIFKSKENNASPNIKKNNKFSLIIGKDITPFTKKKDLNIFNNEKIKINGLKKPFK